MSEATGHDLSHLSPAAGRLGAAFAQPKVLAAICVVALAGLGWLVLGLMTAATSMFDALCRPLTTGAWSAIGFAIVAAMWGAMTLAMMLPSAAPMILTYAEIADTAARKGERIVSPFVLAAGYVSVWLGFAAAATLVQCVFARVALLDAGMAPASGLFSGAIFIAAGLYQFSALKHACLTQCQRPFPFFFSHWATTPRGVFRLGLQPRALLPRLLLGDDAGDVRGRRDERDLDGGARHGDDDREDRHRKTFHLCRRRGVDRYRHCGCGGVADGPLAGAREYELETKKPGVVP